MKSLPATPLFSRRHLLSGAAAALASGIFPEAKGQPKPPAKRLVLIMQTNGTQQSQFWPKGEFMSPILEPLLKHPRLAERTTLVRGVSVTRDAFGTDGNEHDMGFARMFTGVPLANVAGHPWGGGPSVDQLVARAWDTETLALRVVASGVEPFPKAGFLHRNSFVYVDRAQHKVPITDPYEAYTKLFVDFSDKKPEVRTQTLKVQRSILHTSARQLRELSKQLGPTERAKLELHTEAVRRLEARLIHASSKHPGFGCLNRPAEPRNFTATHPELLVNNESAVPELISNMIDLITAGFACDLSRIATLQLGYAGHKWRFDWLGIGANIHDDVAHLDTTDNGPDATVVQRLVTANRFYAEQIATLANQLDAIPESDGTTLLDNTLIVWANELGRGDHRLDNVPTVLIGGRGVGLPLGGRVLNEGEQPFQRLGCTILNLMGVPARGFGDLPECGVFRGL